MNVEAIEARFLLLESQAREERDARLKLEERNISLEQQLKKQEEKVISLEEKLKKQDKDRDTDLVRFTSMNNQLKAQLRDREASEHALELKIKQEAKERKAGDLALARNVGLPRDYSKMTDKPVSQFGSRGQMMGN